MKGQRLLGPRLVEAESQTERIAAGIGNSEKLADGRDVGLAIYAAEAFGDVEDDVGSGLAEALRKIFGGFEADDFPELGKCRFNRRDGRRSVPLREFVAGEQLGDGEVEDFTGRFFIGTRKLPVFLTVALSHWAGELCWLGLLVVGETDESHRHPTKNFALDSLDRVYKRRRCSAIIIPEFRKFFLSGFFWRLGDFFFGETEDEGRKKNRIRDLSNSDRSLQVTTP